MCTLLAATPAGASTKQPLVLFVHGGGWWRGTVDDLSTEAAQLTAAGGRVVELGYTLDSPILPAFPLPVRQVVAAPDVAIRNNAGIDPTRVTLLGDSAGGQLAGLAAEKLNASHPGTIRTVVTLGAPTNFALLAAEANSGTVNGS